MIDGQNKARLFSAALGMTADDAEELRHRPCWKPSKTGTQNWDDVTVWSKLRCDLRCLASKQAMIRNGCLIIERDSDRLDHILLSIVECRR